MDLLKAVAPSAAVSGAALSGTAGAALVFVLKDAAGQSWALKDHLGRERILIVSQPSEAYLKEVRRQDVEPQVRDLRVVALLPASDPRLNGPQTLTLTLLADPAGRVAQQYGPAALIGKDGGVKARYAAPPALKMVLGLIDSMPMRQQERRGRGK